MHLKVQKLWHSPYGFPKYEVALCVACFKVTSKELCKDGFSLPYCLLSPKLSSRTLFCFTTELFFYFTSTLFNKICLFASFSSCEAVFEWKALFIYKMITYIIKSASFFHFSQWHHELEQTVAADLVNTATREPEENWDKGIGDISVLALFLWIRNKWNQRKRTM